MRPVLPAALLVAVLAAACSGGGAATPAPSAASASAAPASAPASAAPASAAATRIEVSLSDQLRIEPAAMTIPAGVPVTFVVTNTGTVLHEFVVGDQAVQDEHEAEMKEAGGMTMSIDEPFAIGVEAGQTKELTMTFTDPGTVLVGCHVIGHYLAGMKAEITIK